MGLEPTTHYTPDLSSRIGSSRGLIGSGSRDGAKGRLTTSRNQFTGEDRVPEEEEGTSRVSRGALRRSVVSRRGEGPAEIREAWKGRCRLAIFSGLGVAACGMVLWLLAKPPDAARGVSGLPKILFAMKEGGVAVSGMLFMGFGLLFALAGVCWLVFGSPPRALDDPEETARMFWTQALSDDSYKLQAWVSLAPETRSSFGTQKSFAGYWLRMRKKLVKEAAKRAGGPLLVDLTSSLETGAVSLDRDQNVATVDLWLTPRLAKRMDGEGPASGS